ncbi:3'-5' exonuclease [Vibrio vulnificus]
MRPLGKIEPTHEQLQLFTTPHPMNRVIRGAAGSGKTTIALLMLRLAITFHRTSRMRNRDEGRPIKAMVFTFNTTLSSYVRQLAQEIGQDIEIEVQTLAKYFRNKYPDIGNLKLVHNIQCSPFQIQDTYGLDYDYLCTEVDYILGRFPEGSLTDYLDATRVGRGAKPRIDRALREKILDGIVYPYQAYKKANSIVDWNDINQYPVNNFDDKFDIIVADETQDFSANELRTIVSMLHEQSHGTFVIDTVQKIYNRGFTWKEVGLEIRPQNSFRLEKNYRNTLEIARLGYQLLKQVGIDADGTEPDFDSCPVSGELPKLICGLFSQQVDFTINLIKETINLDTETVCFLSRTQKTQGFLKRVLRENGIRFADLTKSSEWPEIDTNVVLSTMHSAKGLEFDHVILLGLSDEFLRYEEDSESDSYLTTCKLLTVSITRAKKSVLLGYKSGDKPKLLDLIDNDTYEHVEL